MDNSIEPGQLSDLELVARIEADAVIPKILIDEYYRRCIPIYLDFLGIHWHTGFYRDDDADVSHQDQSRMVRHIANSAKLSSRHRVLDVGCGIGGTLVHLKQSFGCETVGLTPVPEQKKMAEHFANTQNQSIQIDIGHAEALPYPDNSFDVIMFFESACHFEDRQAFFDEAFRVLKPGGRLAGEDWLATDISDTSMRTEWIDPICKSWAIPMLGDAAEYQRLMESSKLVDIVITDMQTVMPLHKGFAVTDSDVSELQTEIQTCRDPLLQLTLKGLLRLGLAVKAGAFTIGQFNARKPTESGLTQRLN